MRWKNQAQQPDADQLLFRYGLTGRTEPLLVLRLPDEQILLATESARALLAPDGEEVVGRALPEFTDAPAGEAAGLLTRGYLSGFQLRRVRIVDPADDLEIWVQALPQQGRSGPVLALLSRADEAVDWAIQSPPEQPVAIGWTDRRFLVQQLNEPAEELIGRPAGELIGQPLTNLVSPDALAGLLFALGQLAASGEAVSLSVTLDRIDRPGSRCQLVLLAAPPAFAFAIQAVPAPGQPEEQPLLPLRRFGQGLAAARGAREQLRPRSGLPELTGRELQIVDRLLAGDRVPAISRQLYLAQSTVRNHLSAVFAKLGVRSQQELIVLLRKAQSRQG